MILGIALNYDGDCGKKPDGRGDQKPHEVINLLDMIASIPNE
jgi:hypothetical protein